MFRLLGGVVKLVTLMSTLMVALEQIRKIRRDRKNERQRSDNERRAA